MPSRARVPFKTGNRVAIIRYRHGWLDGSVQGVVKAVDTKESGDCKYVIFGDDGNDYEIKSTRDLRAA